MGIFDAITDFVVDDVIGAITGDSALNNDVDDLLTNDHLFALGGDDTGGFFDFFSDKDFLTSLILTTPSLFQAFSAPEPGRITPQDELSAELSRENLALQRERLEQQKELGLAGIEAQMAGIEAQREAATKRALAAANQMFSRANLALTEGGMQAIEGNPERLLRANEARIQSAQRTGQTARQSSQGLSNTFQRAALSGGQR